MIHICVSAEVATESYFLQTCLQYQLHQYKIYLDQINRNLKIPYKNVTHGIKF